MGRTLRWFLNIPAASGEDPDWIEREVWRAFNLWEADACHGCGHPLSVTTKLAREEVELYDVTTDACPLCRKLEAKQLATAERDEARAKQLGRRLPTGHRRYSIHKRPVAD